MTKVLISSVLALAISAFLPTGAHAGSIVFESSDGVGVSWKPVRLADATGTGTNGYWDARSYDSWSGFGANCSAGALVGGVACDWALFGGNGDTIGVDTPAAPGTLEYFAITDPLTGESDLPANFYFEGSFVMDWTVLYQLTEWASDVEFGWYRVPEGDGPPTEFHAVFQGGPFPVGTTSDSEIPDGRFGFYYKNLAYGTTFFTQSKYNSVVLEQYAQYMFEGQFWGGVQAGFAFDDESSLYVDQLGLFMGAIGPYVGNQQFSLFRSGDYYWVGLEDQLGRLSPEYCYDVQTQPCSDYDNNDLLIGFTGRHTVSEPTSLALLGVVALSLAAWRRRSGR